MTPFIFSKCVLAQNSWSTTVSGGYRSSMSGSESGTWSKTYFQLMIRDRYRTRFGHRKYRC